MKLFISTDMEGLGGASSWNGMEPSVHGAACYEQLRRELSWVIDEVLLKTPKSGKGAVEEICVCDSHSRGEGLPYGSFTDSRVTHVKGYPRTYYMMEGLDSSFDAALLIGYHARIGSLHGIMDHSYSASSIYAARIDGREVGEVEINALLAGYYGVPIGLISGDDVLENQLAGYFTPTVPYVRTKEGLGRFAGKMYAPERVEKEYRAKTAAMMENIKSLDIKRPEKTTKLQLDLATTVIADAVSIIPGIERISGRGVSYRADDYRDIYRMLLAVTMIGGKFAQYV